MTNLATHSAVNSVALEAGQYGVAPPAPHPGTSAAAALYAHPWETPERAWTGCAAAVAVAAGGQQSAGGERGFVDGF